MKRGLLLMIIAAAPLAAALGQDPDEKPKSPQEQYQALVEEYRQLGGADKLAAQFLDLARVHRGHPAAREALAWVLINVRSGPSARQALEALLGNHIQDEELGAICPELVTTTSLEAEAALRGVLAKSPHRKVQARACLSLAGHLQNQLRLREAVLAQPAFLRRFEQFYGRDFTRHARELDKEQVDAEIDGLYERVVEEFAGVSQQMAETAKWQLVELRHLSVGRPAMEIEGEDIDGVPFKLSDYRGKVVMLTFWGDW